MATFENVHISLFGENGQFHSKSDLPFRIEIVDVSPEGLINVKNGNNQVVQEVKLNMETEFATMGVQSLVLSQAANSVLFKFSNSAEMKTFLGKVKQILNYGKVSLFHQRTEKASAEQYFQFYGYLSQQQNMMQDYIRTSTYQRAMLDNCIDFADKVVLDVGAGSGILSFFAVQAGARKVYAIEASSMAKHCEMLVEHNKLSGKISVVAGKVEEVTIPEQVDVIISEPMGYMLYNERMLESYLHAKKWLKPNGKMFPTTGDLHVAPFTDDALYMEQFSKANFWYQPAFHGVDLSSLRQSAVDEYFKQPIVDTFDVRICLSRSLKHTVDFLTAAESDLHVIDVPLSFHITQAGMVHGLAFWFDVSFAGSQQTVWLSTAPTQPLTHWYQVRCLVPNPVFVKQGQILTGRLVLRCNKRQSYDVDIELNIPGTRNKSVNTLDLKNPFFRYTGQQPAAPPGTNDTSPSDAYWNQDGVQNMQVNQVNYNVSGLLNGMGDGHHVQQSGVHHNNLLPLANVSNIVPVNPGGISSVIYPTSTANSTRTSIGAGIAPSLFTQQTANTTQAHQPTQFSVSNQFLIGDYMIPGNVLLPGQQYKLEQQ